ncbi:MAG TPA: hypothetical protein VH022_14280 [Candidatus Acidoferrum sp.]|jgi:hypothetical protein|nr:hypothetical protein [Candidatus Acidoferrum sp.]
MGSSKEKQVSFRVEDDLSDRIDRAAEVEDLKRADFVRKIFVMGFERYARAQSLHQFRVDMQVETPSIEKQVAEEQGLVRHARKGKQRKAG